jgi:transposase
MASTIAQSVGVDIAKDTFDVYLHPAGRIGRFANDARGRSALIAWLEGFAIARIAFEPTGAYHHALERRLAAADLPLVKVDPRRARRFAEAIGRIDAAMLARFAALLEPPVRPVVSMTVDTMKELHGARRALVKDRVAARNRDHTHRSALLKRQVRARLRQIEHSAVASASSVAAVLLCARRSTCRRSLPCASTPR